MACVLVTACRESHSVHQVASLAAPQLMECVVVMLFAAGIQQWSSWSSWQSATSQCVDNSNIIRRSRTCLPAPTSSPSSVILILCNTSTAIEYDSRNDSSLCASQRLQALLLPVLAAIGGVAVIACLLGVLFLTLCCWEHAKRKSYDIRK